MMSEISSVNPRRGTLFGWDIKKNITISIVALALILIIQPASILTQGLAQKSMRKNASVTSMDNDVVVSTANDDVVSASPDKDYNSEDFLIEDSESYYYAASDAGNYFYGTGIFISLITLALIVILAFNIFSFLQSKARLDMYHSLPIKRRTLFTTKFFTGLLLSVAPQIISALISIVIVLALTAGDPVPPTEFAYSTWRVILNMLLYTLKQLHIQIACYAFMVFIIINTGTVFDGVLALFMASAVYPLTVLAAITSFGYFIYGWGNADFPVEVVMLFAPFIKAFYEAFSGLQLYYYSINGSEVASYIFSLIWWTLFSIGIFVASLILYNRRKSESTGTSYVFPVLKIIYKIFVPLLCGIGIAMIFCAIFYSTAVLIFSFLAGATLAYIIVEAIISRGFKNLIRGGVPYLITVGIFAAGMFLLGTRLLGYETRIPKLSEIEAVRIDSRVNPSHDSIYIGSDLKFTDPETVKAVHKFHSEIVESVRANRSERLFYPVNKTLAKKHENISWSKYNYGNSITYIFELKNGSKISRTYWVDSSSEFVQDILKIKAIPEITIKESQDQINVADVKKWQDISYSPNGLYRGNESYISNADGKKLLSIIKNDMNNCLQNLDSMDSEIIGSFTMSYQHKNDYDEQITIPVYKAYAGLIEFLGDWTKYPAIKDVEIPEGTYGIIANRAEDYFNNNPSIYDDLSAEYLVLDGYQLYDTEKIRELMLLAKLDFYPSREEPSGIILYIKDLPETAYSVLYIPWENVPEWVNNLQ